MAQKKINYGAAPNDGTGDLYRVAMIKIDDNFTDLYALAGGLENNKVAKSTTLALSGGATAAATALNGSAITLDITSLDMSKASGTLAVAHGGTGVTTSTGTGANVQADSPALIGKPTAPLPAADAADGQVANVKYVKDGLSFKANSADVTTALATKANTSDVNTALAAKADKAAMDTALAAKADTSAVNSALALKVDKDGSKVLSDNNYTNDERVKLANIGDGASNDRSKHTGVQPISSVTDLESRLDSALRVRLITSVSVQDFLAQAVALGPGYYRPYSALPVPPPIPSDSAGFLSLTADTFTLFFGNYITGKPVIFSGSLNDINLGTWKVFQIDDAAKLGVQSSKRDANRNKACTPGSFGWGVTPSVNSGDAGEYLSTATIDDASKWVSGVQRCISDKVPGGYADILRVGAGYSGDSSAWFHDVAFTTSGEIHARHKLNEDPWTSWEKFFTTKNAVGPIASSIIENGSNANGEYTKFADGTAMAWGYRLGYVAGDNYTPLPITFTSSSSASMSVLPSTGWQTPLGWYATNSQFVFNMPATNASNGYTFFVLGRWK